MKAPAQFNCAAFGGLGIGLGRRVPYMSPKAIYAQGAAWLSLLGARALAAIVGELTAILIFVFERPWPAMAVVMATSLAWGAALPAVAPEASDRLIAAASFVGAIVIFAVLAAARRLDSLPAPRRAALGAALDAAWVLVEGWKCVRGTVTEWATVYVDPLGRSGALIPLSPPVVMQIEGESLKVEALRVEGPGGLRGARPGRALRAVAWLYRERPEAGRDDWRRCAEMGGQAAPPEHYLGLYTASGARFGVKLRIRLDGLRRHLSVLLDEGAWGEGEGPRLVGFSATPAGVGGLTARGLVEEALRGAGLLQAPARRAQARERRRRAE